MSQELYFLFTDTQIIIFRSSLNTSVMCSRFKILNVKVMYIFKFIFLSICDPGDLETIFPEQVKNTQCQGYVYIFKFIFLSICDPGDLETIFSAHY